CLRPKRQRTAALQDLAESLALPKSRPRLGVRLSFAAFVMAFMVAPATPATPATPFKEGLEAYRAADYGRAAVQFQVAARLRPSSGALQNLGLAEWQRGHTGEAILAWEQARRLDRFNHAAEGNLKYVRRLA